MNERVERRGHPATRHTHPHGARDTSRGLFPSAQSLFPLSRAMSLAARILLAASVALLASSEVSAETMDTTNTMDDASDMLADFARYEMDASTLTLVNASTGAPLSERSAAALSDADPETPDDFDLGLFVHASDMDPTVAPGSTVNVTVCDFSRPENCAKAVPYPGAPEEYACGESDETKPDVGFECVALEANVDEDGDLSLVEMDAPLTSSMCPATSEERNADITTGAEESGDEATTTRRRFARRLMQARQASPRRRPGRASRSVRTAGVRGYRRTRGSRRRGGSRGRKMA